MSRFTRKGTVSKGSGPIHLDSYALKGIPIRYTPPIFVPELMHLPLSWKPPVLPSQQSLYYDYSVEKKVLEQAKHRAVSIAAEASLQMKEIQKLREASQLTESRDPDSDDSTENSSPLEPPRPKPRPPIIPSSDILTPTPVSSGNVTGSQSGDVPAQTGPASGESSGQRNLTVKENDTVASLGQMSIREFEGDVDPFEITSLQAINDMEILQTVLQPIPPPIMTSAAAGATHSSTAGPTPPVAVGPTPGPAHQTSSAAPTVMHGSGSSPNLQLLNQVAASSAIVTTPPAKVASSAPSLPIQVPQRAGSTPSMGVAGSSSPSNPFLAAGGFIPTHTATKSGDQRFPGGQAVLPPISIAAPPISTNPFSATSPPEVGATPTLPPPPLSSAGASVGTLIDIGQHAPPTVSAATPPMLGGLSGSSNVPARPTPPVPKPRTAPAAIISHSTAQTSPAPVQTQRGVPVLPSVTHGRPGLGVPVLPPIPNSAPPTAGSTHHIPSTTSSGATIPALPPPPYKARPSPPRQQREVAAPPPYAHVVPEGQRSGQSSPRQPAPRPVAAAPIPPPVTPRTYKLPDPSSNLNPEQISSMSSIAGMGFPSPRVARALIRCKGDKSKVFDFLFLVGRLEEQGHSGDSAETALLACNEKPEEAAAYLSKVEMYRGMGFAEKGIHEAYIKSKGDWDKVLDVLVQGR